MSGLSPRLPHWRRHAVPGPQRVSRATGGVVLAAALLLATPLMAEANAQATTPAPLTLRPGDAVKLVVWESPNFSGEFEVAPNGTLRHPLLNRVPVAGIPLDSVRARLVAFLGEYQREPAIDLAPLVRVTVGGEVRSPGVLLLPPETLVSDAVVKAGSTTATAKERTVALERGGRKREFDPGDAKLDPQWRTVQSGDRITVPRANGRSFRSVILPILQVATALGSAYLSAYIVLQSRRDLE